MIEFERFTLKNGLRLLVHRDESTPIAAVNTLYDVGARDENPNQTGFAHLFEHLMFGGSVNVPNFDTPLQRAGGNNNAFTNNDFTNYYITIPVENIDTAFWLESDRMLSLAFSPQSLAVQKKVVIEEFKQRYLNQPYGDVWLKLRPMAYKDHPYQWATIGKSIDHIEDAELDDVKRFFKMHYQPSNAILVVAGNVEPQEIYEKVNHWFGSIASDAKASRKLPAENGSGGYECEEVFADVPQAAVYFAWPMADRYSDDYPAIDLLTDILSRGKSARLYKALVADRELFTSISCYITGSIDPGLLVISGMLNEGKSFDDVKDAVMAEVDKLVSAEVGENELEKVKNKFESQHVFSEISAINKAMNLAYYELLGDANDVNGVVKRYREVTAADIQRVAKSVFSNPAMKELRYKPKKNNA
ncbi:MAG: M16 family metallopeptidase [Cryomorphaceae bacterium]|nr:insulinase family protein [Flavobacteriales bacterium]